MLGRNELRNVVSLRENTGATTKRPGWNAGVHVEMGNVTSILEVNKSLDPQLTYIYLQTH